MNRLGLMLCLGLASCVGVGDVSVLGGGAGGGAGAQTDAGAGGGGGAGLGDAGSDAGLPDAGGADAGTPDSGANDAGEQPDGGADAGVSDGGAVACTEGYNVPPTALPGWSPALSNTGAMTLTWTTGHSHDDGLGPLGFCPAVVASGDKYLALVSARFETDGSPPTQGCPVDPAAPSADFAQYGMCFSGGNHNVYVEVRDESGARVVAAFDVFYGGAVDHIGDQGKPPNEFPMNYAIYAGGSYGVRARYQHPTAGDLPSDAITNLRMPIHHHVNYLLTFQVKTR